MNDDANLDRLVDQLEATGDYRVLRRIAPRQEFNKEDGAETKIGLIIDTETTGLDPRTSEIIELAMLAFSFSPDGRVFRIADVFAQLRQPSHPIPPEITKLTGIDDSMVAGKSID
ncbi:exonuclease domain-containing protein [Alphaproteobacteria bacterium]|nr:exonuclease domain-containing protein [Alphaproteobacteria bacterium]